MSRARSTTTCALVALALFAGRARADEPAPAPADSTAPVQGDLATPPAPVLVNGLEPLQPELASHPYALAPGARPFQNRLCVSPGFGSLGTQRLFVLRIAYNPSRWLGYEAMLGHNPNQAVHAVVHMFNAIVRKPISGRLQPYLSAGYGMTVVLPGKSLNADPVTKNTLAAGGGLEIYIRSDLALRAEMRGTMVLGRQQNQDGIVAYDYREQTIGLSFYRSIRP